MVSSIIFVAACLFLLWACCKLIGKIGALLGSILVGIVTIGVASVGVIVLSPLVIAAVFMASVVVGCLAILI